MLRPDGAHAPWVAAAEGASASIGEAAAAVRDTMAADRIAVFNRLATETNRLGEETGVELFHLPRYGELVAEARGLARLPVLSDSGKEAVGSWLDYDGESKRLCGEIRDWPGRADTLRKECPSPDAALEEVTVWREKAEPLLAEARGMTADGSDHGPHLDAMADERRALGDATQRLDAAIVEAEYREMGLLMGEAAAYARETGGIAYDAPGYGPLMERARSLDARPDLPQDRRETVRQVVAADERWAAERKRVGTFVEAARGVESERGKLDAAARAGRTPAEELPEWGGWQKKANAAAVAAEAIREEVPAHGLGAHLASFGFGPDEVDERKKEIEERIERDERAREQAALRLQEQERTAEQARIAAQRAAVEQAERDARQRREKEIEAARERAESRNRSREQEAETKAALERSPARGREKVAEAAPDRTPTRDRDASQRPSRGERQAARLAQRLDTSLQRRDALLEKAEKRLLSTDPVSKLGLSHTLWRRDADRAVKAGRELLDDPRHAPHLDALGGRAEIAAGVRRLERAAALDGMSAYFVAGWEALQDRVRETGQHRFFLPEHEKLCSRMSSWETDYVKDADARQFMRNELDLHKEMTLEAERLDRVAQSLQESLDKREQAERSETPFVRQEGYDTWRYRAENAVNGAREILRDGKYEVHFENRPGLRDSLRDKSFGIERQLDAERAQWEDLQRERSQAEQQQVQTRSQGMSW